MIGYFVTIKRGKRVRYLAGPFDDHADALATVDGARKAACDYDPWCDFDYFGTADKLPKGIFNV